ncbi:hypothetical protein ACFX1Q_020060 [Malus domestica]
MAYSGCSAAIPSLGGFEFSSKAARTSILGADNLQTRDFVSEEPYNSLMLRKQDTLQTPGVSSQRLSIGMTDRSIFMRLSLACSCAFIVFFLSKVVF